MMGSGTVLALARSAGHRASGIDIDPLAVLISRVWTTKIDRERILHQSHQVLIRANQLYTSGGQGYPKDATSETKKFIRYWFDNDTRRQLACLATCIGRLRHHKTRDVLWCAFSRLIITKQAGASLAQDLSHSRPHKVYTKAPIKPFERYLLAVKQVVENCIDKSERFAGPASSASKGDARKLRTKSGSIDLVLTSPPYLNAIDYIRCSKFSLVWMGHQIAELSWLRSRSVGTEIGSKQAAHNEYATRLIGKLKLDRSLSARHQGILTRFIEDMHISIKEVSRVLVPGGKAVYVLGENTLRGTYICNSKILIALATRAGLCLSKQTSRALPPSRRYLPPPTKRRQRGKITARMRREVILTFRKPKIRTKSTDKTVA
jgi:hypothetical protein